MKLIVDSSLLEQALEALENHEGNHWLTKTGAKVHEAATTELRTALDTAEKAEPVGIYNVSRFRGCASMENCEFQPTAEFSEGAHKLYLAPVASEDAQDAGSGSKKGETKCL